MAFLQRLFGPHVQLAPELRRELLRRQLDELDDEMASASDEEREALADERLKVADDLLALGGDPRPRERPDAGPVAPPDVSEAPVVVLSVGRRIERGRQRL